MKDYSLNEQERKKYITDLRIVENEDGEEVYEVEFADGQVFTGIEVNDENFQTVEEQMERQANDGVARISNFINKKRKAIGTMVFGGALTVGSATIIANHFMTSQPAEAIPIALGVIGVYSLVQGGRAYLKTAPKAKELSKIKYLKTHQKTLDEYSDYPNSLEGLNEGTREYFEESDRPFLMVDIDDYSEEDLRTIVGNLSKEKEYQFVYK